MNQYLSLLAVDSSFPQAIGKIKNLDKFDALFFGIHNKQVQAMDPMGRILLEVSYEAIVDAGVNPTSLRGSNTGVFIGSCASETMINTVVNNRQVTF